MFSSYSTTRRARRYVVRSVAVGVVLLLSPVVPGGAPALADAPAAAFVGLARGARGDSVRALQQALVNQGVVVTGGVDGIFGAGTEAALKDFQEREGLTADGAVDAATELALGLSSSAVLGLSQGTRGTEVKELQQALIASGLTVTGGADGVFGPATSTAVRSFQQAHGLAVTGIVDAATAAALGAVDVPSAPQASDSTSTPDTPSTPDASAAGSDLVGLSIGSRGDAVKRLQRLIMGTGVDLVGGDDGAFGALTANALKSFQTAKGLTASGTADEATVNALAGAQGGDNSAPAADDGQAATSPLLGLKYGSLGAAVKELQQALLDAGVSVRGGADGVFGTATQTSLEEYQTSRGLESSGRVDDATLRALTTAATPQGATSPQAPASAILGLAYGSLGGSVAELQQALIDAGVTVRGGADGIFGPATTNALKEFQTSQGLKASGIVDDATIAALASPSAPSTTPSPAASDTGGYAAYGEKGARVSTLQSALVQAGISLRGGVDGDFGSGTSAAVMEFQRQHGLSVTGKVDETTATALGISKENAPSAPDPSTVQISVFPVQGTCHYGNSFGYDRSGGRTHLGVDIIAPKGNLLYAVVDGKITKVYTDYPGSLAGNGVRISMPDGTYFFYAHMSELADGIELGTPVKAGQIVGTVGNTGNSGTSHLHMEIHPQGGSAVNPYPIVKAIDGCSNTAPLPQP